MKTGTHRLKDQNRDRLSDLPDCVLLHILSFLSTPTSVQSCILSTRWKHLWKHLTTLTFNSSHFKHLNSFTKFVSQVLSLRDSSTPLHILDFKRRGKLEPCVLNSILKYAHSHNVQQLRISVKCSYIQHFSPPCFYSCQTLTSLSLSTGHNSLRATLFPNDFNLPALTNLSIQFFTFSGTGDDNVLLEPFSKFKRLNTLIIDYCKLVNAEKLYISSATLANLTIKLLVYMRYKIELSYTPSLCTFVFVGIPFYKLSGSNHNLSSVKHLNIHVNRWPVLEDTPFILLNWLVELPNIESLTLTLSTLEVLSKVPDLLKLEFSSLYNLKSLKVKMHAHDPSLISNEIVNFLLQNAPLAERVISRID